MRPQNMHVQADGGLNILWSDTGAVLNPCNLRRHCRCVSCRHAWLQGQALWVEPDVQVVTASPVGSYGVQLHFSDGHDHGVFAWSYLRELAGLADGPDRQARAPTWQPDPEDVADRAASPPKDEPSAMGRLAKANEAWGAPPVA